MFVSFLFLPAITLQTLNCHLMNRTLLLHRKLMEKERETTAILKNSTEAIITKDDAGLKYSNDVGVEVMQESCPEEAEAVQKIHQDVENKRTIEPKDSHTRILEKKAFKEQDADNIKSLKDFFNDPEESFKEKRYSVGEQFFEFKRQSLFANNKAFLLLRVIDVSDRVKYRMLSAKQQLL